jgi:AcrR family transcriptional regulator
METKQKIMDSAFSLFAEKGTEFSLHEVAREVGIRKASIYAHFNSKEDLLYAVIDREIDAYFFKISEECRELKSIFFMILDYYDKSISKLYFWKRLLLFPPKAFEETLVAKINGLSRLRFGIVTDIIKSNIAHGFIRPQDPEAAALSFFSVIHGLLSSIIIYKTENLAGLYESIWQGYWNGIK